MIFNRDHLEFNPNNKNKAWADRLISYYRQHWAPVIDPTRYNHNMNIVLAKNNMNDVVKMFRDPKKLGFRFIPIAVIEKLRNILFGERHKAGVSVEVRSVDPSAEKDERRDRNILKTRKDFEALMTYVNRSIGLPSYDLSQEKAQGNNPFKGNMEAFDEMGLDPGNPQDVSYFFQTHYKLLYEMDSQEIINCLINAAEVATYIEDLNNDIMAVNTVCGRMLVNQVTGGFDYAYLQPDKTLTIPGSRNNSKTAVCNGFEDDVTVGKFLQMAGDEFDANIHLTLLVNAVSYRTGRNIVQISEDNAIVYQKGTDQRGEHLSWDDFSTLKVGVGYIEWKSYDAVAYKIGKDFAGNTRSFKIDLATELQEGSPYMKEVRHKEVTYKAHYLSISSNSQLLFGFGKLYHQAIDGMEDEYSNYSIFWKTRTGPSIAEVAEPWIEYVQELFYKQKWMVRKSKPKGRSYNYESLVKMAKHLIAEGNLQSKVTQVIRMFEEGINEIFTLPEVNGEKVGGGVNPHQELPNGLDPTVIHFKGLIEWCYQMIAGDLGFNDLRTAESLPPNSGFKLQMNAMESSRNATEYINALLDDHFREMAKRMLLISHDVIRFKTSVPYKYLCDMVGQSVVDRLDDFLRSRKAPHRFGIFVVSLSTYNERQEIKQQAFAANQKGEIPFEVLMLINETLDYRKAAYILSYEKKRAERLKLEEQKMLHDQAMTLSEKQKADQIAVIEAEGKAKERLAHIEGYYEVLVVEKENEGELERTREKLNAEPSKQEYRTQGQISEYAAKATIDSQHGK